MDDDLVPITAPKRGRPRKQREEGVQPTMQTAAAPVSVGRQAPPYERLADKIRASRAPGAPAPTVDEIVAAHRAAQPVAGAPPQVPEVLSHDPGSVSRETNGTPLSLGEMSEADLEAELARRRGQVPPAVVAPGDIRLGDDRPAPAFTASPAAEAARIAQMAGGRLVESASPVPMLSPEGNLIAPRQFSKDPRTWPNGEQRIHDPFAPPVVGVEPEPGYVEAEVILKDGSKKVVKVPLQMLETPVAETAPSHEGMTLWRCLQDGTPGGGGYVPSGCPDFWAQRVPGVHVHCPRCHSKTVWELPEGA